MKIEKISPTIPGTQAVTRALSLLKLIANYHPDGVALKQLVDETGLDRTTAYRLVSSLVHANYIQRDSDKNYHLGLEAMNIGLCAMRKPPFLEAILPAMKAIARHTEDTIYLVVRNGDYGHCLHREEGAFPIRTLTMIAGSTRLLGLGNSSRALLSLLDDDTLENHYRCTHGQNKRFIISQLQLLMIKYGFQTRGYSYRQNIVIDGACGVGRAVRFTDNNYVGISVSAIKQRMDESRRLSIVDLIGDEVKKLGFERLYNHGETTH